MHWNVYYHRTTKGYEELLKAICERARDLVVEGKSPPGPRALLDFVARKRCSLAQQVSLDDHVLMAGIAAWQDEPDPTLSDLCRRFMSRRGFKPVEQKAGANESQLECSDAIAGVKERLRKDGREPKYYLRESASRAVAYDNYHPEKEPGQRTAENSILIEQAEDNFEEISSVAGMERLKAVTGIRERRCCFYVPEEHRDCLRAALKSK